MIGANQALDGPDTGFNRFVRMNILTAGDANTARARVREAQGVFVWECCGEP